MVENLKQIFNFLNLFVALHPYDTKERMLQIMNKTLVARKHTIMFGICVLLILTMIVPCSAYSIRKTTDTTHTSSMHPGGEFLLRGYLYYSSNTSTSIVCDYLGVYVKNTGTCAIDTAVFKAFNGKGWGNNNDLTGDYYNDPTFDRLEAGELVYHKTPVWALAVGVSSTYLKYGNAAIFEMGAGITEYDCASHQIWCYSDLSFVTSP